MEWKIGNTKSWIKVKPPSGKIQAGASLPVSIVVDASVQKIGRYEDTLTLEAAEGKVTDSYPIQVMVLLPYKTSQLPEGESVLLSDVDIKRCVKYMTAGVHKGIDKYKRKPYIPDDHLKPKFGTPKYHTKYEDRLKRPYKMVESEKEYTRGLWARPNYKAVYNIEGLGYKAFSSEVGFNKPEPNILYAQNKKSVILFEIRVDGKIKASSGLMGPNAQPRLLVVTGLENAKTITFEARRDDSVNDASTWGVWSDPKFYK